ncbi:hypothetical protein [Catellatospora sp. NPDC049609]|uniref:hypothetical protein n=1 Tax=Catellatospora sp. NPDC049609 TaxID=3155505 RepID=UPI0034366D43
MDSTTLQQAAWHAYVDVTYGLQRAICDGERYDGEVDWEWAGVADSLGDRRLVMINARLLALLDQARAHWRDCPTESEVLTGYLNEIADGLRDLADDHVVEDW